ncbi:non-ribosomal peptide synthetase [Streptomyces sp. NPDC048644]|uniref:non-ribosomal peptide synthetase n=1 Tax=Streptomyces sp. NPDC048644 TaxID=3365582 RepID=UPI00371953D8
MTEPGRSTVPGATDASSPRAATHELFERQARRRPRAPAVRGGGRTVGYGELDSRAHALAQRLTAAGAGPGTPVAVASPRSVGHIVATLAVWKTGGVCVPVDPLLPRERSERLLVMSGAQLVVGPHEQITGAGAAGERGTAWSPRSQGDERTAYVFFTSGSSGEPKAVGIPHRGIVNEALWTRDTFGLGPGTIGSWLSSPGFALTRWELWSPLTSGACVAFADEGTEWDAAAVQRLLLAAGVTWSVAVTRLGEQLMELDWPTGTSLQALVTGGEQLRTWPRNLPFRVYNSYGITETSGVRLIAPLPASPPGPDGDSLPPIGLPIRGTHAYVLDDEHTPVAEGAAGELYIGGIGLAHGYLGRPGMTAARFLPDPFRGRGQRMYRTGDLVRRPADGLLRYVGRADDEVKIKGVRLSPAEVESALLAHDAVASALVRVDSRSGVVCYLVRRPGHTVTAHDLRAFLAQRLPSVVASPVFVELSALPLLSSGKADRRALPEPHPDNTLTDTFEQPHDGLETTVATAFRTVLGVPAVSRHDDFFALGGDSLQLGRLKGLLEQDLGLTVPASALFAERTPRQLASLLSALPAAPAPEAAADLAPRAADTRWIDGLSDDEVADLLTVIERTEGP